MERSHPEISGPVLSHSGRDTLFHLTGSLIGKGQRQYGPWIYALLKQMGNLVRKYTCFSGTCTGNDHAVAFRIEYGIALARIEFTPVIYHFSLYLIVL